MTLSCRWLSVITLLVGSCSYAQAQVITSAEYERGMSISGPLTNGYVPFSHRYFYSEGAPNIYVTGRGAAQRMIYLDYLDRLDRAQKFGYPIPADPFFHGPPQPARYPEPRPSVGGFGFFRWR